MRALWICLVAACGSSHGATGDAATGDGAPPGDGSAQIPLADAVHVTTFPAMAGVLAGGSSWRIWGQGDLRVAPVYTVAQPCSTLVGYTTAGPHAYAAVLSDDNGNDSLMTTLDLGAFELRGLAAAPGGFAALLWDPSQSTPTLHVQSFDVEGHPGWSADLSDALAAPTDFTIGESRLEYGNGTYAAYYHVHGISGFATGHEGDQLKWIDAASGAVTNGWSWGCSHSMSELLRTSGSTTLAACVTDCYPGTTGSNFATDSIGGIYLDNATKVIDVDGGCNGSVAAELGGMAPGPNGWSLVFNGHQNAATPGQSSYAPATMNQDIGFASIAANGTPRGAVTWLTTTPGNESDAAISLWLSAAQQYLVGWNDGGTHRLARVAADGTIVEGPVAVQASWGERDDPFRSDGDTVVWAWFDAAGSTELHFARVAYGPGCVPL